MCSSGEHRQKHFMLTVWFLPWSMEGALDWWGKWLSWLSLWLLAILKEKVKGEYYRSIFSDHLHPMLQNLRPGERSLFQDENTSVHTDRCVQTWLNEHHGEVEHLTWCHHPPDLNTIEFLWVFLENKVRLGFLLHAHYLNLRPLYRRNGCEFP